MTDSEVQDQPRQDDEIQEKQEQGQVQTDGGFGQTWLKNLSVAREWFDKHAPTGLLGFLIGLLLWCIRILSYLLLGGYAEKIVKRIKRLINDMADQLAAKPPKPIQIPTSPEELKKAYGINYEVFCWFKDVWNMDKDVEKQEFLTWMEQNYLDHLQKHMRNRDLYFKETGKLNKQEAILGGTNKVAIALGGVLTLILGYAFSANADGFWELVKQSGFLSVIPVGVQQILLGIGIAILLFGLLFVVGNVIRAEYNRKMGDTRQRKETWLRHQKAIWEYQAEMLGFVWKVGAYGQDDLDMPEKLFMDRMLTVWGKNCDQFQKNMNKTDECKVEKKG